MAKLLKRLGNGYWIVQEFEWKPKLKRKVYIKIDKNSNINRYVIINHRKVKVFM